MANYDREIALVGAVRDQSERLSKIISEGSAMKERWDALGGSAFLDAYFADGADLGVTQAEIDDAMSVVTTLDGIIPLGARAKLHKARRN